MRPYYISQVAVGPPRFTLISNAADLVHPSYTRYIANPLRERFGFEGVPIRISFRNKRKKVFTDKPEE